MKKILVLIIGCAILVTGCSNKNPLFTQATQYTSGQSGIKILAALKSGSSSTNKKAAGYGTPPQYSLSVSSIKVLKSLNDTSPYVVFNNANMSESALIDLKSDALKEFGTNVEYPPAGTYTYLEYQLNYVQIEIVYYGWPNAGSNNVLFRAFGSTYGNFYAKHLQVYFANEGVWKWDNSPYGISTTCNLDGYKVDWDLTVGWKENNTYYVAQADPLVIRIPLTNQVVVPANPTGLYVGTMSFNITNKIKWNDRNGDGLCGTADEVINGDFVGSQVNPLPPDVTVTFTKQ
jgi:hypothetical protein